MQQLVHIPFDLAHFLQQLAGESEVAPAAEIVWTSALTGQGVAQLKEKILEVAAPAHDLGGEFITNLRHQLIQESLGALDRARHAADRRVPHEMLLLGLYDALRPLDTITGATYADEWIHGLITCRDRMGVLAESASCT